jgi:tRNA dimethylallyltransferase
MRKDKTLLVLAGPTAVGKTDLSIQIARHFDCPIISSDSRQIYKELKIGTAAPSDEQLSLTKHYFIGHKSIHDYYSAWEFEQDTLTLLDELFNEKDYVLMTGGSMMYIDAVCNGIDEIPTISDKVRTEVWNEFSTLGATHMQERLKTLDPVFYEQVDLNNTKRIIHAIEICLEAGQSYSSLRTETVKERPFNIIKACLNRDREELFERISQRVDLMIKEGLIEEAKRYYHLRHLNSLNTVGYKEIFQYLSGEIDLEEAIRLIKRNTRRYAKKQLSWFRLRNQYTWFHPDERDDILKFFNQISATNVL